MWNNLEHKIWNKLKRDGLDQRGTYLLAVSGGLDSMALSALFKRIKPQAQLVLMHYHHGDGVSKSYRNQCWSFLQKYAAAGFIFESETAELLLRSENDFRQARWIFFEKMKQKYETDFYVTAHHQNDVLETRLLKLLRGSGLEGLQSFKEWNRQIYRPFFDIPKSDLLSYAESMQVQWLEDPSNSESQYFRNWMRNEWLPILEKKSPGSVRSLAQSLENIALTTLAEDRYITESVRYIKHMGSELVIERGWLNSFSTKDQLSILIRSIKSAFLCDFSTSQIKEVLRRLDKNQNEHIFTVAGINWVINARNIVLSYSHLMKK